MAKRKQATKQKETLVKFDESLLSLYIKTVELDHSYSGNAELAVLIQEVFGMECTKEHIDNYQMNFVMEDYEKESRMIEMSINPEIEQL